MNIIRDIFKSTDTLTGVHHAGQGRRQPKYRLFPPGARLVRV